MKRYKIHLTKLNNHIKKYKAIVLDTTTGKKKTVLFGASGYQDYLIHKNDEKKNNYILRHKKNENWDDLFTAGFYSRWLLWNKKTLQASIKDVEKRYNAKIIQD